MEKFKIVADSSADVLSLSGVAFDSAPLKIITKNAEYVDDQNLDVAAMVKDLSEYKGKSSTSCPNPEDWLSAFGDAEYIFCVTITGTLSGSYSTACIAKDLYESQYPQRKVFVINSLSAGPELKLIINKIREMILNGQNYSEICQNITEYTKNTGLIFMLESMKNLANNGRVSSFVAKTAGLLGIRVVGKASEKGDLEPLDKCRGNEKALRTIVKRMKDEGYNGGKVFVSHCLNEESAKQLKSLLSNTFKNAEIDIYSCLALCSFYAEKGGMLIGFEKN